MSEFFYATVEYDYEKTDSPRVVDEELVRIANRYNGRRSGSGCFMQTPRIRDIRFCFRSKSDKEAFVREAKALWVFVKADGKVVP